MLAKDQCWDMIPREDSWGALNGLVGIFFPLLKLIFDSIQEMGTKLSAFERGPREQEIVPVLLISLFPE